MTFKLIDYKNGNVDSKWVSFDTFDGRHVEGIAYTDDRSNIRVYGYNGIVIANQGGNVMVPSSDVFADSIRFIEPFTAPRIVLMDNTSITCQIDNPKPNGSYVQVVLLNGRRIKIHGMSIKYIEEPFYSHNDTSTTASNATTNANSTTTKPGRIIENPTSSTDTDTDNNTDNNTNASTANATANTVNTNTTTNTDNAEVPQSRITVNTVNHDNNHNASNINADDNDDSPVKPSIHTVNHVNSCAQFNNPNPSITTVNANNANNTTSNAAPVALNTDNDADNSVSFDDNNDEDDDLESDSDSDTDTYADSDLELDTDTDANSDSELDSDSESDDFDDDANASNKTSTNMSDNNHVRMSLPVHRLNNASNHVSIRRPVNLENPSVPTVDNQDLSEMLTSDDYDDDIDDQMNEPGDNTGDSDDYWDDNDTILDLDSDDDNGMNII